ncbi:uncharacterized protein KZ484_023104 [Pholidichthys leucotaenia]
MSFNLEKARFAASDQIHLKRPSNMKKSMYLLDVRPLIWNRRRKKMYVVKEEKASGVSCSEGVQSFDKLNNGCCGSYLAELESTDLCNDDISSSYANGSRSADFRSPGLGCWFLKGSAPETPQGKFYAVEPSQMLQDIAANKNTKMLTELLIKVEQMSRDIQFLKTEIALNIPGADPESQREEPFPIILPLANEEQFDEAEAALKEETVRRKMITRLALVGGTNSENTIRRMLSATMANSLACIFNWVGKGLKRAFKDTLMQDCMFASARQFDRKLTELQYRDALQKWLRYAPERSGGHPMFGGSAPSRHQSRPSASRRRAALSPPGSHSLSEQRLNIATCN